MKALSITQDASKLLSADGVQDYLRQHGVPESHRKELHLHEIDGLAFCFLTDKDLHEMNVTCVGQRKRILFASSQYRKLVCNKFNTEIVENPGYENKRRCENGFEAMNISELWCSSHTDNKNSQGDFSVFHRNFTPANTRQKKLVEANPKPWKVLISALYLFLVAGITSFVMVIAHERLPDISKYPPLPDLFLDNLPYIGWAFEAAEWVGVILGIVWVTILLFHRYRSILLRRFFAISGTVFLLRSITMVITSLSVPGQHLAEQCSPYAFKNNTARFNRFLEIWFGMGMSIRGIQTCGDYMFSGHTTMLTLLNFFITEYSPHNIQAIHTFSWVLNLFGVFFILASHEHYSIDVFVAVYVSSRLFLYYHCLANSRILCQEDKNRAMIWFPLFTLFEYDVCGIVPNEYELPFHSFFSKSHTPSSDLNPIDFSHDDTSSQPEGIETICDHLKTQ